MRLYQLYCLLNLKPFIKNTPPIQDTLFFQRPLAFNYKQKAINLFVLCTINKSG